MRSIGDAGTGREYPILARHRAEFRGGVDVTVGVSPPALLVFTSVQAVRHLHEHEGVWSTATLE